MKQFCMKIDLISQRRENVLFLPSNMAATTSHESALLWKQGHCLSIFPFKGMREITLVSQQIFLCWKNWCFFNSSDKSAFVQKTIVTINAPFAVRLDKWLKGKPTLRFVGQDSRILLKDTCLKCIRNEFFFSSNKLNKVHMNIILPGSTG